MITSRTKILIVDDEPSALELLEMHLSEKNFEVRTSADAKGLYEEINSFQPQIVILDVRLPDADGLDLLKNIKEANENTRVIVVTAFHDMATTIKAIKRGAFEYIPKPIDLDELDTAIERAVELSRVRENSEDMSISGLDDFEPTEIVGKTKEIKEIFKTIGILSNNRLTVLIEGETGTGKELVARAIHFHGPFRDEPFIAINCAAIIENLLESELFGHEKGAFTGAVSAKKGKFEMAGRGTILLDEICEMPVELQAKLLRVLQDKEFHRVGGERAIFHEARVIASTNRDTLNMVQKGLFREDLYYRLNVATIRIPPLRERLADIPLLVEYLLKKINRNLNKRVNRIEAKALVRLGEYSWPGNVRELENLLTIAVMRSQGSTVLDEVVAALLDESQPEKSGIPGETDNAARRKNQPESEKYRILNALQTAKWHYGNACKILGISYPTLKKRIKQYDILPKPHNQSQP